MTKKKEKREGKKYFVQAKSKNAKQIGIKCATTTTTSVFVVALCVRMVVESVSASKSGQASASGRWLYVYTHEFDCPNNLLIG